MRHAARVLRGIGRGIRRRPGVLALVALVVAGLSILGPPLVLSVARRPVDYATVNPWLRRLPAYVADPTVPWAVKLEKLPALALVWFSADSPQGGVDWGFAVDVTDVGRILLLSLLLGCYFALWASLGGREPGGGGLSRAGGAAGLLTSALSLSTGPCSVMGCGAPVLPVVGLAFAGLSSGTLALLASLSRVATAVVLVGAGIGVAWLGWRAGADRPPPGATAARTAR